MERTSDEYRDLFKKEGWPDPPEGEVKKMRYMNYMDLYVLVDGNWYWSREAREAWALCPYGPPYS